MKGKIYRIVAFLAVAAVLILQALWMVYTFLLFVQRGSGQIADSLFAFFSDNWLLILASVLIDVAIIVGIVEHIRFAERQKRLDDIRKDFSSAMIHDMKSPLSSIVMGIRALQSGKPDGKPEIKRQYYRIVEEEAEHLLGLTNRLLAISKLESHNLVLSKVEVELRPMVEDVIDKFRAKTKKKLTVKMSLNADSVWGAVLRHNGFYRAAIPDKCPVCYSAADFAIDHPKGIYVLGFGGHVATVKDGLIYDAWDSSQEIPQYVWYKK
jgi:two-component system phosphate regulon sensor histidine kinase PhoR